MMDNNLGELMHYKAWCNKQLFNQLSTVSEQELLLQRQIVFGNILRTVHHVYLMDQVWQSHLLGIEHHLTSRNPKTSPAFPDLVAKQQAMDEWYVDYCREIEPNSLTEVVDFTFIDGGQGQMSRRGILFHVINHASYHRGHIAALIYQIPALPPTTDYTVYLQELQA